MWRGRCETLPSPHFDVYSCYDLDQQMLINVRKTALIAQRKPSRRIL